MGRKGNLTLFGMTLIGALSFFAMWRGVSVPDSALAALATMVVAFCGGNAAATFAHAGSNTQSETLTIERTAKESAPKVEAP